MRKYAAPILAVMITVLAFFLPEALSRKDDDRYLNNIHVIDCQDDQEGFSQLTRLSVAEKLQLLRSGGIQKLSLPQEKAENMHFILGEKQISPVEIQEDELTEEQLRARQLWGRWVSEAYREVRALQKMGAIPVLWQEGTEIILRDHSQSLYVVEDTQVSFPVYALELIAAPYAMSLTVDAQSGRIMSLAVAWAAGCTPDWDYSRSISWKDYWGMDSINGMQTKDILREMFAIKETRPAESERTTAKEVLFTFNEESVRIPFIRRDLGTQGTIVQWNCSVAELAGWRAPGRIMNLLNTPLVMNHKLQ